jgi:hypothetical protein
MQKLALEISELASYLKYANTNIFFLRRYKY